MRAPKVREMGSRGARRLHSRRIDPRPPSARRFGLGHASPPVSASGPAAVDWPSFRVLVLFQYRIKDLCVNEIQLPKRKESSIWLTSIGINLRQLTICICLLSTYARAGDLNVTNLEKYVENFTYIWPIVRRHLILSENSIWSGYRMSAGKFVGGSRSMTQSSSADATNSRSFPRTPGRVRAGHERRRRPLSLPRSTVGEVGRGGANRAPSSRSRSWPDFGATMGSRSWQPLQFQVPSWRPSSRPALLFSLCPIFGISKVSVNFLHFRDCCFSESMVNHRSRWASPIRACANCAGRQRNKGWSK